MGFSEADRRILPRLATIAGLILLCQGAVSAYAQDQAEVARLRESLTGIDAELKSIEAERADVAAQAEEVAQQIAELDRQQNLGPVQRRRYSKLKQDSQDLAERMGFLDARRTRLNNAYEETADELLPPLGREIDRLREGYDREPVESEARARLLLEIDTLVRERQTIQARLARAIPLLYLDPTIEEDDTAESLRRKAELLADNLDILARLVEALVRWKGELVENRLILEQIRLLQAENEFIRIPDPRREQLMDLGSFGLEKPVVPKDLAALASRFDLPEEDEIQAEGFERLITSIDDTQVELEEQIGSMTRKRQDFLNEAVRREGTE